VAPGHCQCLSEGSVFSEGCVGTWALPGEGEGGAAGAEGGQSRAA